MKTSLLLVFLVSCIQQTGKVDGPATTVQCTQELEPAPNAPRSMDRSNVLVAVPTPGLTVSGDVHIAGDAPPGAAVTRLCVDGALVATASIGSDNTFTHTWNSDGATLGMHVLELQAVSSAGAVSSSSVTVFTRPRFDVKEFGAQGDGATDDGAAFQRAIDTAGSMGGGTVFFPSGTYIVHPTTPLHLYDNLELRGEGAGSLIKIADDAGNFDALFYDAGDVPLQNVSFADFHVDLNPPPSMGSPRTVVVGATQSAFVFW